MRKQAARDFCLSCINQIFRCGTDSCIENPAIEFNEKAKRGEFDTLTDKEFNVLLDEVETLAKLFNDRRSRTAGNILLDILNNANGVNYALKDDLINVLACLLTDPSDYSIPPLSDDMLDTMENFKCDLTEEMLDDLDHMFDHVLDGAAPDVMEEARSHTPRYIRDSIARQVIGQPEALKAAALITYNHLSGRRTNAVFAGPSGCGKSEIWRSLSTRYPGLVRMVDFSRFSAEGWLGSLHLRDIFEGINPKLIRQRGLIVVLDEADKIVCEHAIGGGGTDHNALLQNDLLKMMDGDVIEFGEENKKPALSIDCSKVSVVMLGAFEKLLEGKAQGAKHIGFGSGAAPKADAGSHRDISHDDLIGAGMRREIAGRVNRIVALEALSVDDYRSILMGPVLSGLQDSFKRKIIIDRAAGDALAERAIASGLGVRWMRSQILNAVDDELFDEPEAEEYAVTMRDGKLLCRAQAEQTSSVKKPRYRRAEVQEPTPRAMRG